MYNPEQENAPMTGADLATMYEFSYAAIERNLDGVTHEESLRTPQPAGCNLNWVLGQVVVTRGTALTLSGKTPVLSGDAATAYRRAADPNVPGKVLDLATLRGLLQDSQQQLIPALAAMEDGQLAAPLPEKFRRPPLTGSVGDSLARLQNHEMYHAGQLGLLRRILGKEGAIR